MNPLLKLRKSLGINFGQKKSVCTAALRFLIDKWAKTDAQKEYISVCLNSDRERDTPTRILLRNSTREIASASQNRASLVGFKSQLGLFKRQQVNHDETFDPIEEARFIVEYGREGELFEFTAEQVTGMYLRKLIQFCRDVGDIPPDITHVPQIDENDDKPNERVSAVFSIPTYWKQSQKQALLTSASIAAIDIHALVYDTTAAGVCYACQRLDSGSGVKQPFDIIMSDLGSFGIQISVLRIIRGQQGNIIVRSLAHRWNLGLGGDKIDRIIVNELRKQIINNINEKQDTKSDQNKTEEEKNNTNSNQINTHSQSDIRISLYKDQRIKDRLYKISEKMKRTLTIIPNTTETIELIPNECDIQVSLSRERLNKMICVEQKKDMKENDNQTQDIEVDNYNEDEEYDDDDDDDESVETNQNQIKRPKKQINIFVDMKNIVKLAVEDANRHVVGSAGVALNIQSIEVVGGMSRVPVFQDALEKAANEVLHRSPSSTSSSTSSLSPASNGSHLTISHKLNADEAVAWGCGRLALQYEMEKGIEMARQKIAQLPLPSARRAAEAELTASIPKMQNIEIREILTEDIFLFESEHIIQSAQQSVLQPSLTSIILPSQPQNSQQLIFFNQQQQSMQQPHKISISALDPLCLFCGMETMRKKKDIENQELKKNEKEKDDEKQDELIENTNTIPIIESSYSSQQQSQSQQSSQSQSQHQSQFPHLCTCNTPIIRRCRLIFRKGTELPTHHNVRFDMRD